MSYYRTCAVQFQRDSLPWIRDLVEPLLEGPPEPLTGGLARAGEGERFVLRAVHSAVQDVTQTVYLCRSQGGKTYLRALRVCTYRLAAEPA